MFEWGIFIQFFIQSTTHLHNTPFHSQIISNKKRITSIILTYSHKERKDYFSSSFKTIYSIQNSYNTQNVDLDTRWLTLVGRFLKQKISDLSHGQNKKNMIK